MGFVSLVALVTCIYFLWIGDLTYATVAYVVGGVTWLKNEFQRSVFHRSLALSTWSGTLVVFLFWPIRMIHDFRYRWRLRQSEERFVVVGKVGEKIENYGNWDSAIEAAKKKASYLKEQVMVLDQATLVKQSGIIECKSWFVNPDGTVEELF